MDKAFDEILDTEAAAIMQHGVSFTTKAGLNFRLPVRWTKSCTS